MPNLSPGSQRPFTLQDIFSSLNQDVENANSNNLSVDNTATQVLAVSETMSIYDEAGEGGGVTVTAATMASQHIGAVTWGNVLWTS